MNLMETFESVDASLTDGSLSAKEAGALVTRFEQLKVGDQAVKHRRMVGALWQTLQFTSPLNQPGVRPAAPELEKSHKLHYRTQFQRFDISIENRRGSVRKWYDPATDTEGQTRMLYPYGYIRLTEGADGDHVDVFLGPDEDAKNVYVVHQMKASHFRQYDEDKCMMGFASAAAAKKAYLAHYDRPDFFGSMTTLPLERFRSKVYRMKRKMIKAQQSRGDAPELALEPREATLDDWQKAITAVGLPAERFHLVVKYARQGHEQARKALDAVYAELRKGGVGFSLEGGVGFPIEGATTAPIGTMGHHSSPARTAGENVRSTEPRPDWPVGRQDMKKKNRRPKRDVIPERERLDHRGLTPGKGNWAHQVEPEKIVGTIAMREKVDETAAHAALELQVKSRIKLREGGKLSEVKINS